jgi:hypothetical protein
MAETYCWMVVGERVINMYILEEIKDMLIKESLDLKIIKLRVDEYCSEICFQHIRECLRQSVIMVNQVDKSLTLGGARAWVQ